MSFEDKTLNDNVRYARHAISIDENRAAFARVGWGDPHGSPPDRDADGFCTFEQLWFSHLVSTGNPTLRSSCCIPSGDG